MDSNLKQLQEEDDRAFVRNHVARQKPAAYLGLGTTGIGMLRLILANGGSGLFVDGATNLAIPSEASDRIGVIGLPKKMYREYVPIVRARGDIFFPDLADDLGHRSGGDQHGGATRRAFGRLGLFHENTRIRLAESTEEFASSSRVIRNGDMDEMIVNIGVSAVGGQGSGLILDLRKASNSAFLNEMAGNVHNVIWLIGPHAFSKFKNKAARQKNFMATMLELAAEMETIQEDEARIFDHVFMIDLPAIESDEVRAEEFRTVLRFSNPNVWKPLYNAMINSEANANPQVSWLQHFVHFAAGSLGPSIQVDEVLSAVARAVELRGHKSEESVFQSQFETDVKYDSGDTISTPLIYQYMKQGDVEKVISLLSVKNVSVTVSQKFTIDGRPVKLDEILYIPVDITNLQLATKVRLLTEFESTLAKMHEAALLQKSEAEKVLSREITANGAMRLLLQMSERLTPRAGAGILTNAVRGFSDSVQRALGAEANVAGSVKQYLAQINDALKALEISKSMLLLIEGEDENGLISLVKQALEKLHRTSATNEKTLAKLAGTSTVSPFASSLVTDRRVTLVDGLVQRGAGRDAIVEALRADICSTPLTIEQFALLLGCRVDVNDITMRLKDLFESAQTNALYWGTPRLQPWLKSILLPLIESSLFLEIQKRIEEQIPNAQVWIDEIGNGTAIGCAYGIAHGVHHIDEVIPSIWIRENLPMIMADKKEHAARFFVDRPLPEFVRKLLPEGDSNG